MGSFDNNWDAKDKDEAEKDVEVAKRRLAKSIANGGDSDTINYRVDKLEEAKAILSHFESLVNSARDAARAELRDAELRDAARAPAWAAAWPAVSDTVIDDTTGDEHE